MEKVKTTKITDLPVIEKSKNVKVFAVSNGKLGWIENFDNDNKLQSDVKALEQRLNEAIASYNGAIEVLQKKIDELSASISVISETASTKTTKKKSTKKED